VGTLIKRYKRFLADFRLEDGTVITAHCANTGSMRTCMEEGAPGWLTYHDNPKRKLKYSWQACHMPDGWVGINTAMANGLVEEAIMEGVIGELQNYSILEREKKYGNRSRIDILLRDEGRASCYVEVKNVTLLLEEGVAAFPDAVTQRGAKHLEELVAVVERGERAVLLYCVQRQSAAKVVPAREYDPHYAATLEMAMSRGVEVYAYGVTHSLSGLSVTHPLPLEI